jgi:hypothetical protein
VVVDTARCLRAIPLVAAPPRKEGKAMSSGPSIHFEAVMKLYSWTRAGVLESKGPSCPTVLAERGQKPKVISKAIQSSTQVVPSCPLPLPWKF